MDNKIDMSLDEIIKIDRKEKRQQFKAKKQKAPQHTLKTRNKAQPKAQPQAKANLKQQQNRRKKPAGVVGSKVKQFRGQVGGNRVANRGQFQKKKQSVVQQKAATLKRKAKQAPKVGKQRLVPGKRLQRTGVQQRLQIKGQQVKDARELLVNQRRGLQAQTQPRGRGRGARGSARGRGRGIARGAYQQTNPVVGRRQAAVIQQPQIQTQQINQKKTRSWQGKAGIQQRVGGQAPGMLTMTIVNKPATTSKAPVRLNRNPPKINLKQQQQTGRISSLSDRFGRIQALRDTVAQQSSQVLGGAKRGSGQGRGGQRGRGAGQRGSGAGQRGRGAGQRGRGAGQRGRGGQRGVQQGFVTGQRGVGQTRQKRRRGGFRNTGPTDRSVVIL